MTTAVSGSFTSPPATPSNYLESGQRIFQVGVNVTGNRQEQGRGRLDVSMAWASTHTCLDNCLHNAERHSSTPMLPSCWRTRWVRFPRAALQYFTTCIVLAAPCIMRTHVWEKVHAHSVLSVLDTDMYLSNTNMSV